MIIFLLFILLNWHNRSSLPLGAFLSGSSALPTLLLLCLVFSTITFTWSALSCPQQALSAAATTKHSHNFNNNSQCRPSCRILHSCLICDHPHPIIQSVSLQAPVIFKPFGISLCFRFFLSLPSLLLLSYLSCFLIVDFLVSGFSVGFSLGFRVPLPLGQNETIFWLIPTVRLSQQLF